MYSARRATPVLGQETAVSSITPMSASPSVANPGSAFAFYYLREGAKLTLSARLLHAGKAGLGSALSSIIRPRLSSSNFLKYPPPAPHIESIVIFSLPLMPSKSTSLATGPVGRIEVGIFHQPFVDCFRKGQLFHCPELKTLSTIFHFGRLPSCMPSCDWIFLNLFHLAGLWLAVMTIAPPAFGYHTVADNRCRLYLIAG